MTITRIVNVPYTLPHAHLYLDDVEQICHILAEASRAKWPEREIPITFSTRSHRMDSIEDLERHERSTSEFSVDVRGLSVELRASSRPRIQLYTLDDESAWATYSKIKEIFDARQYAIKNAVTQLPDWLKFSLWPFFLFIFPAVFTLLHTRWFVDAAYYAVLCVFFFLMIRPSRVSFVRSHERSKSVIESRENYIKAIGLLFAGAVIGKLVEVASRWIKTH